MLRSAPQDKDSADTFKRAFATECSRMGSKAPKCRLDRITQALLYIVFRVYDRRINAKATSLKSIIVINQIIIFCGLWIFTVE